MANFNLGTARGIIQLDYKGGPAIKDAARDIAGLKNEGSKTHPVLSKLAVAAGAGLAGGLVLAINSAKNFEKGLSAIGAVTGASGEQMDALRQKALKLGQDTAFSASESASAMEELAKAGLSVPDILNGAADAAVALAAAGGIDLPEAATIASNAMNQFGLTAEQLPGIADKIAGAANASAIDVGDFGQSMQQAGAVANLAGLSFDDTALAITAMGNAGIKGSDAGTSLKTFLQNLQPTTKKQTNLMKELGLVTEDGANKFFDASGKIKSMSDIAGVLGGALKGMSDQQKTATLETLFGSDAIRAAAVIADTGADGMDNLAKKIGGISAADVAAKRMDNLDGSIEQLKGSAETLAINFGSMLTGGIRAVVDSATGFLQMLSSMKDGIQGLIDLVIKGDFTGAFGKAFNLEEDSPIVDQILSLRDKVIAAFQNIINFIKGPVAGMFSTLAAVFGPAVAVVVGVLITAFSGLTNILGPLGGVINSLSGWMRDNATVLQAVAVAVLAGVVAWQAWNLGVKAVTAVTRAYAAVQAFLNAVMAANPIMLVVIAIAALVAGFLYLWNTSEGFRNFWIGLWEGIKTAAAAVVNWFTVSVPAFFSSAWNAIKMGLTAVGAFFSSIWNTIVSVVSTVISILVAIVRAYINTWRAIISGGLAAIRGIFSSIWNAIRAIVNGVWVAIRAIVTTYVNAVRAVITTVFNAIRAVVTTVMNAVRAVVTTVWNAIKGITSSVWNGIRSTVTTMVNNVRNAVSSGFNALRAIASNAFNNVKNAISTAWNNIMSFLRGGIANIKGIFSGAGQWLWNAGKNIIDGLINGIKSAIGGVKSLLDSVTGWIPDWKGPPDRDKKLLRDSGRLVMTGFIRGIVDEVSSLRRTLGGVTDIVPTTINANVSQISGVLPAGALVAAPTAPIAAAGDTNYITVQIDPSDLVGLQQVERFVATIRQQARMRGGAA